MVAVHTALKIALLAPLPLLLVAACVDAAPPSETASKPVRGGPEVDMACVERARQGALVASVPTLIDGFDVAKEGQTITLHRAGRALSDAEGEILWPAFSTEYFSRGGLASGSNGLGSIYTCPHANKAGCFHLSLWACQTSPERLVAWMREATDKRSMGDAEIEMVVELLEAPGPSCKADYCPPAPHYSKKDALYYRDGAREPSNLGGAGACESDRDCEGAGTNGCRAWYLRGGAETLIFIQVSEPTFCGCVDRQCTWFEQ